MDATLAKKLLLKAGTSFFVVSPPREHAGLFEGGGKRKGAGLVLVYATTKVEVEERLAKLTKVLGADSRLWVAYPKAKRLGTDLNRDVLGGLLREHGFQAVRMVSIDETWSAMWFKPL